MKNVKTLLSWFASLVLVCLQTVAVQAQKNWQVSFQGSRVRWEVLLQKLG